MGEEHIGLSTTYSACELDILLHDSYSFGVNSTQVPDKDTVRTSGRE
jgi:hypothetical protein